MPRQRATRVVISPSVRAVLAATVRTATAPFRCVQRARIVLLAGAGASNAGIARRVGCSEDTARVWRDRFAADPRAEALLDLPRSGRPAEVSTETRIELIKLACSPPHPRIGRACWSHASLRAELAATTGVTLSASEIGRILRNEELRPHRMQLGFTVRIRTSARRRHASAACTRSRRQGRRSSASTRRRRSRRCGADFPAGGLRRASSVATSSSTGAAGSSR